MDTGVVIPDQEDGKWCQVPVRIIKAGIVKSDTEKKYKEGGGKVIYKGSRQHVAWSSGQFVKEEDGDEKKQIARQADEQRGKAGNFFHENEYNDYQS